MAYRWHPKLSRTDPDDPRAWATCDRCGFVGNLCDFVFQWDYRGSPIPQNTRILTCGRPTCLDAMQPQLAPYTPQIDPVPLFNIRTESYSVDEAGPTQNLVCEIRTPLSSIGSNFYLDLFDEPPNEGGTSVLATLTGSAVRTNYANVMAPSGSVQANTSAVVITSNAVEGATVWYVVIFDAATGGNILMNGPLGRPQTVTMWNGAEFAVGALTVALNVTP